MYPQINDERKSGNLAHTDNLYMILDPSVKTNRTPCFDTMLPSTWATKRQYLEQGQ